MTLHLILTLAALVCVSARELPLLAFSNFEADLAFEAGESPSAFLERVQSLPGKHVYFFQEHVDPAELPAYLSPAAVATLERLSPIVDTRFKLDESLTGLTFDAFVRAHGLPVVSLNPLSAAAARLLAGRAAAPFLREEVDGDSVVFPPELSRASAGSTFAKVSALLARPEPVTVVWVGFSPKNAAATKAPPRLRAQDIPPPSGIPVTYVDEIPVWAHKYLTPTDLASWLIGAIFLAFVLWGSIIACRMTVPTQIPESLENDE
eukprot:gnl/Chilomastix_cuspidata/1174.p4 GENE.gnl/Chilomastix_cuspidata/1174~~gnl/Chilomastix_cuspidata/1174.p4  ORF type:complete len:263 (+),score=124.03 gnl/Chilomastix_cuspidata/1174:1779-2567(+)